MICGLGITECLLAASGGNGPGVADRSQARELAARARASRLPLRLPLADCLRPKGWKGASCEVEKDCLSPPRLVQTAEIEFWLLFGTLEACISVVFILWAYSHLPESVTILEGWILASESIT